MRIFVLIALVISFWGCKVRAKRNTTDVTYDVTPPEMLQDPNPAQPIFGENTEKFLLNTNVTPCVTQISPYGTMPDRSWREAFSRAVMQRICGKDPATAKPWRTATAYNPDSWVAGINLTAVTQNVPRGTAITPRHVVYTKHYGFHGQVGQTLNFLTMDNRVISRKIIEVKFLSTAFDPDIAVARLESDLPGSITPMKVLHPNATNYAAIFSPLLRIDQESKALIVQATPSGPQNITTDATMNPPGAAYRLYYEDMISGDSSSPSILLMNTNNGVMPILFGVVTYSGPGQGPRMGAHFAQIQTVIESFGDAHKMVTAPEPASPKAAPNCSVTGSRVGNTNNCVLTVIGSADDVTGNPVVTPAAPISWSRSGNTWSGQSICSLNSETTFSATLTGPGGPGRSCESNTISPVVALPTCTISAKRKDQSDSCDLRITQTAGRTAETLNVSPTSAATWARSGTTWSGSAPCPKTSATTFSATFTNPDGKGPACVSDTIPPLVAPPACAISAARSGNSDNCIYTLTRTSGAGTVSSFSIAGSSVNWDGNTPASNTIKCSQTNDALFMATVVGPNGSATCTTSVAKLPPPGCALTATRQASTASCSLTINGSGIIDSTKQPVLSPAATGNWNANQWAGTASCPTTTSSTFSATIEGPGGSKASCTSNVVAPVPTTPVTPPACAISAARSGNSDNCIYTLTRTSGAGTVSSFSIAGSSVNWDGNKPASNTIKCSQTNDALFMATVVGPNGSATCTTSVAKLTPPACTLSATRQGTTASCSLTLTGSGVIETSKQPVVVPAASGSWSSSRWTGTGNCPSNQSTTFDANIEGPGGSKAGCKSNQINPVPQTPVRSCRAEAVRRGATGNCILTITVTGQMTGNPRVTPYAPPGWSRSGNQWIGNPVCPVNRDTHYSVNLSGPDGNWGCASNKVTAIRR